MNRWKLTDELRKEYKPIIEKFIDVVERKDPRGETVQRDLTNTRLNPYTLGCILEELGYERIGQDDNGWEMDFWIYYHKDGYKSIQISGTGMIFELIISEDEVDHYELKNERERELADFMDKNSDRIKNLICNIDKTLESIYEKHPNIKDRISSEFGVN